MRNTTLTNYGLLILRLGLGTTFILHGYPKLISHEGFAKSLTMAGIPGGEIAAILSGIAEVVCGALLIFGFLHRLASFGLIFNMAVAVYYHIALGGSFWPGSHSYAHALELLIVFVAMFIAGPGSMAIESKLSKK